MGFIDKETFEKDSIEFKYKEIKNEKIKDYFRQISTVCNQIINEEINAHLKRSRKYISINNVSKIANISRQTLYSYPILIDLINAKAKTFKAIDDSEILSNLKAKNSDLKKKISQMISRDIQLEILLKENKLLKDQVNNLQSQIKILLKNDA